MARHDIDLRDHINRRLEALRAERQSYFSHWRELSDFILPRRGRFLVTDRNQGGSRSEHIIDNTATLAARTLASGMMAGLTSPARRWFRLATDDPALMKRGDVADWLSEAEGVMRDTFARSNAYACLQNLYEELAVFGTGAMIVQSDPDHVIRCRTFTAGEYLIAQDDRQAVNTLYREFSMTVGQVVAAFGTEHLSDATRSLWEQGEVDAWVEIVHAIEPNPRSRPGAIDARFLPYRSVYLEKASADRFLRQSGYAHFPVVVPRWSVTGADIYGRGPGMDALPDVKQLQHEQLRKAQGIDKMVNPPMVAPASLKGQAATVLPGGVTYVDTQEGQASFQPAYRVEPRLNELTIDIQETQQRINRAFYADLFLMLNEMDRAQVTAREVDERREEKLLMLGPVLERLHSELLTPLVDRTFRLLLQADRLPEPPKALQTKTLHVSYVSMLDRAQQALSLSGVERLINAIGMLAPSDPSLMKMLDAQKVVREYATRLDVPANFLKSEEDMAALTSPPSPDAQQQSPAQSQTVPEGASGAAAYGPQPPAPPAVEPMAALQEMLQQAGLDPVMVQELAAQQGLDLTAIMAQVQAGEVTLEDIMSQAQPLIQQMQQMQSAAGAAE